MLHIFQCTVKRFLPIVLGGKFLDQRIDQVVEVFKVVVFLQGRPRD